MILGLDQAWPEDPRDHCLLQAPRFNAEVAEQNEIAEKILALPQGPGPRPIKNLSAISAFSAISALQAGVGSPPAEAVSPGITPKVAVRLGQSGDAGLAAQVPGYLADAIQFGLVLSLRTYSRG